MLETEVSSWINRTTGFCASASLFLHKDFSNYSEMRRRVTIWEKVIMNNCSKKLTHGQRELRQLRRKYQLGTHKSKLGQWRRRGLKRRTRRITLKKCLLTRNPLNSSSTNWMPLETGLRLMRSTTLSRSVDLGKRRLSILLQIMISSLLGSHLQVRRCLNIKERTRLSLLFSNQRRVGTLIKSSVSKMEWWKFLIQSQTRIFK